MTITLIVVLVALLVAPILFKSNKGMRNMVVVLLSLVGVGAVGLNAYQKMSEKEAPAGTTTAVLNYAAGWKLGQLLAADFPEGGTVLAFQAATGSKGITMAATSQAEGIKEGIGDTPLTVVWVNASHATEDMEAPSMMFPSADALRGVEENPGAVALLAFMELPMAELSGKTKAPLYVLDSMMANNWTGDLEPGAVKAVIRPRADATQFDVSQARANPSQAFASTFEVIAP